MDQPSRPGGSSERPGERRRGLGSVGGLLLRSSGSRGAASPGGQASSSPSASATLEEQQLASSGRSSGSGDAYVSAQQAMLHLGRADDEDEGDELVGDVDEESAEQAGRELLARMQELAELQRQLEGLRRATAQQQLEVGRLEAAQAAGQEQADSGSSPGGAAGGRRANGGAGGAAAARLRRRTGDLERNVRGNEELQSEEQDDDEDEPEVHAHVTCDGCGAGPPLHGRVMSCVDCEDFDFCARCYRDRERLGHPRDHRFTIRRPGAGGARSAGGGSLGAGLLLQLLEGAMLEEAMRRSSEGDAQRREAEEAAAAEARAAAALEKCTRMRWSIELQKGEGGECAMCLEDYKEGEEVLKLPCGHFFHEECVMPWFHKAASCPLCQREVCGERVAG